MHPVTPKERRVTPAPVDEIQSVDFRGVARRFQLELILLFGSHVSTLVHKRSDIDIAVLAREEAASQLDVVELTCAFMTLLKSNDIDLVSLHHADYFLRYEVTQNCRLLYEARPNLYLDYAYRALQAYEAHKPLENLRKELLHEQILHQQGVGS